jgi:hypothetical protein
MIPYPYSDHTGTAYTYGYFWNNTPTESGWVTIEVTVQDYVETSPLGCAIERSDQPSNCDYWVIIIWPDEFAGPKVLVRYCWEARTLPPIRAPPRHTLYTY